MKQYTFFVNGIEKDVQNVAVSAFPLNRVWTGEQRIEEQREEAYFVSFDLSAKSEIKIEVNEDFDRYEIRPRSFALSDRREGRKIFLTVDRPMNFTVEIDGMNNALHVFANPPQSLPTGDVIYYGAGEHKADLIWLESNQTLFIDEGAVVYGVIYAKDAENIKIMGRGVLDASPYRRGNDDHAGGREVIDALLERGFTPADMKYHGNLVLNHCKNCFIEGVILKDAPMWSTIIRNGCENITVDNIKIVGQWRYNSDGINICTSKKVTVKNSFIRSFDDCIITRGAYLEGEDGNVENVLVENCVLWCDWGKCIETWCGHKPTEIKNVVFKNNYLIHINAVALNITVWYGSDKSVVKDIKYEDIYIDLDKNYYFLQYDESGKDEFKKEMGFVPSIVQVSVERLGKMVDLGSQRCEAIDDDSDFNVYFGNIFYKNVKYVGEKRDMPITIKKYSEIHTIENVRAENCDFEIQGWEGRR